MFTSPIRLYMKRPSTSLSFTKFLDVMGSTFQLALACFCAGLCGVLAIGLYCHRVDQPVGRGVVATFLACLNLEPRIAVAADEFPSVRAAMLTTCMFGAMIFYAYNACMTSILTAGVAHYPINSLEDALRLDYGVITHPGPLVEYFHNANAGPAKAIYENWMKDENKTYLVTSPREAERRLLENENLVFFVNEEIVHTRFLTYPCQIIESPALYNYNSAWAFHKESPYVSLFSHRLDTLNQAGVFHRVTNQAMRKMSYEKACTVAEERRGFIELSYDRLLSLFLILGIGVAGAFFQLINEKWMFKRNPKWPRRLIP